MFNNFQTVSKDREIKFRVGSELKKDFETVADDFGVPVAALLRDLMAFAVTAHKSKNEEERKKQVKAMMANLPKSQREQIETMNKAIANGEPINMLGS